MKGGLQFYDVQLTSQFSTRPVGNPDKLILAVHFGGFRPCTGEIKMSDGCPLSIAQEFNGSVGAGVPEC